MDAETSKSLGIKITKFRNKIRETALKMHKQDALWLEEDINTITILADRMNRGYFKGQQHQKNMFFRDFKEDTAPGSRKKGRKRKPLDYDDMQQIAYRALCKDELRKDVAKEMRVSP